MMSFFAGTMTRLSAKLRSTSGESLPEVLIAMLVACMATVALVAMTLSASSTAQKTREAFDDVCNQETAVARSAADIPGAAGDVSATVGSGSTTIRLGSVSQTLGTKTYVTEDFSYYEVADADKETATQAVSRAPDVAGAEGGA